MDLQTRAKNILTQPAAEWPVIASESSDVASLLRDYAAPLSAVPAICRWLGMSIIGVSLPFMGTYRVGLIRGFANAVVSWVLGLVGAWLAALVIEKLAPTFQSRGDTAQALKLVVFASTPVWIAGVLNIIPALGVLVILAALYAVYLCYVGVPTVMHTPPDKVVPYMVVSALVMIVVSVVVGAVAGALVGVGGGFGAF
jgi:hypothetical protein